MTAVDAAIEARILNAMGDGTSFSNDNLGLEGFDAAFSSASVTNTGFPSGQPTSQISSPFMDHLDIHRLSGYPPEDITSWLLGEQHQNSSASGKERGFPLSPTLIVTDADQEQQSTAFPFTNRLRSQSFSSVRELSFDPQHSTQQNSQIYQQLEQEIANRDRTIQELKSTNDALQSRIQSLEMGTRTQDAQLATMQRVLTDLWSKIEKGDD
ncbi:hypothetical protein I307_04470 [Cryptococcus deuterogattii 99/473]|uniref:Uncharacterized protein n=1 Tax=Cryptococcus deuterogattii Ram5 TaxID=1296110 RepID=A0A0D0T923_9TREE|nr:hypothetical protein I313_01733 [Cryptococcus deuterogattii Ram5]KIY56077.1 hypothetical protein I307_04470 [Cryptococcus deuterogattii 99/473]